MIVWVLLRYLDGSIRRFMKDELLDVLYQLNPWLQESGEDEMLPVPDYIERIQTDTLLLSEWDSLCTILIGPRRAGKTTLGLALCQELVAQKRFETVLYINCDYRVLREWLHDIAFLDQVRQWLGERPIIIFIDEVQRLENPGLQLKMMIDLQTGFKFIASGSSQLEMKSKVQEHLTGRQIESLVLPLSSREISQPVLDYAVHGFYPQITRSSEKSLLLQQLYDDYMRKDIIEFLKIGKQDVIERLLALVAHGSGQLVNYSQLATDCQVALTTIKHYIDVFCKTFVLYRVTPFVGNKRHEIVSNPVLYFLDNGFRNQALQNFTPLENRTDAGLLVEGMVLQELVKLRSQYFKRFGIHYWRTKGGAEVDFVLSLRPDEMIPVEVKYRTMDRVNISRGYRSFLETYKPKHAFMLTKDFNAQTQIGETTVSFISFKYFDRFLKTLLSLLNRT